MLSTALKTDPFDCVCISLCLIEDTFKHDKWAVLNEILKIPHSLNKVTDTDTGLSIKLDEK